MNEIKVGKLKLHEIVGQITTYVMYAAVAALILEEAIRKLFGVSFLKIGETDYRTTIGVVAVIFTALAITSRLRIIEKAISALTSKYLGVVEVLEPHVNVDIKEGLMTCRTIRILTLSGSITGNLSNKDVLNSIGNPKRVANITILLGNPFSESIMCRYQTDEPQNYEAGPEGIRRRLFYLYSLKKQMSADLQNKFTVKVFDNYPTISVLQLDRDVYSSVYGYKLRGNDCPKVHADIKGEYGKFLLNHFEQIEKDAMPLEDWVSANEDKFTPQELLKI